VGLLCNFHVSSISFLGLLHMQILFFHVKIEATNYKQNYCAISLAGNLAPTLSSILWRGFFFSKTNYYARTSVLLMLRNTPHSKTDLVILPVWES